MLTFLRKIRRSLIESTPTTASAKVGGSTRKYFLYAIGEIALVVIGILIALQINNWNENKKETTQLHNYMESIRNNINEDIVNLKFIQTFRDSSSLYSRNYLRIAEKDVVTLDDFYAIANSHYKVYIDQYFEPRKSGFEALKNSGLFRNLSGTEMEDLLNDYYYLVDKIREKELSLNNTIESMENVANTDNYSLRLNQIQNSVENKEESFHKYQKEIKRLINNASMKSANFRNRENLGLQEYYDQIERIANDLILEINSTIIGKD